MKRYLIGLTFIISSACGPAIPTVPSKPPPIVEHAPSTIQVGVARADITMPPGAATFGHGPDARVAEGYWTRAYCRVFYFETASGQKLALVPCELAAMSALLQRSVVKRVQDLLHASQVMITAVHTHAGVAHYFGESQYTGLFSTRRPGFDQSLLDALADRIAAAIRSSVRSARSARLSWSHYEDFFCFTRNRSLAAYERNAPPFMPTLPEPWPCPELVRPDYRAIDPALDILRIDALDPADPGKQLGPIGSISFFAMHPTVVSNTNRLFGGDVAGVVSRLVERELRRQSAIVNAICIEAPGTADSVGDPLHGIIVTNEGDISPIWTRGDIDEAIDFGERLADFIWKRHPSPDSGKSRVIFDLRYLEDMIRGAVYHDQNGRKHKTCKEPEVGQGAARGATDHPTSVSPLPIFETQPPVDLCTDACFDKCQIPKQPLLGPIARLSGTKGAVPAQLPLAVAQIDDTAIAFVPAEPTVTAGRRITERMLKAVRNYPDAPKHALIAGLSNSYIQYVATEEEYQLQAYEGASTLYGPGSNGYFADRMTLLVRSMFDLKSVKPYLKKLGKANAIDFAFGPSAKRLALPSSDRVEKRPLGTCRMAGYKEAPRICFYWHDAGPGDVALRDGPWIRLTEVAGDRLPARVCFGRPSSACDLDGALDDRGIEFRTRIHDKVKGAWVWSTLFAPEASVWQELANKSVQIQVSSGSSAVRSEAFSRQLLPKSCTLAQERLCLEDQRTDDWHLLIP